MCDTSELCVADAFLPVHYVIELRGGIIAIKQRIRAFSGLCLGGTGVHGHESFVTLVLRDGHTVAPPTRLQKPPVNKTFVRAELRVPTSRMAQVRRRANGTLPAGCRKLSDTGEYMYEDPDATKEEKTAQMSGRTEEV